MTPIQMDEVLKELTNQEGVTLEGSKEILQYIYQTGYEKVYNKNCHYRLKTDVQALKAENPKEGNILENNIREMYKQLEVTNMMTKEIMHRIFDGMEMQYKPGFYDFFVNNLGDILVDENKQKMLSKIQRQWEKISEIYLGQRITFDMCENYMANASYKNLQNEDLELAKLSMSCGYDQRTFEKVKDIYHEQLKRTKSSIPCIQEELSSKSYTYKVLRLDDPSIIFVGELTHCCQAINDAGESCMRHSATSPNGRVLVVQDAKGKVLSQSWIWRNQNVLCLDNIEAVRRESNHKRIVSDEILNTLQKAAKELVKVDKANFEQWKQEKIAKLTEQRSKGEISDKEFELQKAEIEQIVSSQRLTRVTVGEGYSDISLKGLKPDYENRYPEEDVKYISDSRSQFILYEDEKANESRESTANSPTIALYSDGEETQKLIDIDTSEVEKSSGRDWDFYDDWTDNPQARDDEDDLYDLNFTIAKNEVENFVRNFLNNTLRQEAQEFLSEITRSLQKRMEETNR